MTTTVLAYIPSPAQGVWHIGPVPIRAYALFIIVGIVAALIIGDRRWEARGGERGVIYDIALWAVPFGLIGGRLYHVITDWPKYFGEGGAGLVGALRIWDGGLGIWGAVALGGFGAWIACRSRGIPLPAFGDAIAPGIILAQAIGRLGNYFNQELYGRPTTVPWGLEIYEREGANGVISPDLANGVSTGELYSVVHPTFLYELLWNVLIFAVLIWVDRRFKIGHGRLFALYVAGYCLGRFWVELLRSDQATLIADIRVNTFTSTFVFIGAVVYIMVAPKGREDPASLKGKPRDESLIDEVADELVAVAATSGVVAAAKAAGADEDKDARAVGDEHFDVDSEELESEDGSAIDEETAADAKLLAAAVHAEEADESGEVEDPTVEAPEEVADSLGDVGTVEDADAVEAEEADVDVESGPEDSTDAESESDDDDAEAVAEDGAESVGGVGAVEGEDAVAAQEAAPEVHEAVVEGVDEAGEVAAEVADDAEADEESESADTGDEAETDTEEVAAEADEEAEPDEAEADHAEADEESESADTGDEAQTETEDDTGDEAESVGGVGAVEGEDAVAAQEAAPEVHEAAVEGVDEAEDIAAELAAAAEAEAEVDEESADGDSESVGGVGAVEGEDAVAAQEAAPEVHEAVVEGADAAEGVAAEVAADEAQSDAEAPVSDTDVTVKRPRAETPKAEERGSRLRRIFRRRNG